MEVETKSASVFTVNGFQSLLYIPIDIILNICPTVGVFPHFCYCLIPG